MKNKTICALFLLLSLILISSTISAQTITVTPAKTVYKRPKPLDPGKRTFTVTRPKIKGTTPALVKKIETAFSYEKNFDFTIQEEIKEIQWLSEASYKVDYNKNGILNLEITIEGVGAYPDSSTKSVVVNVKTGNRVAVADVFTNLTGLAAEAKKKQQAEIKQSLIEIKKEDPQSENVDLFDSADFTAENLSEFSISDKGVTFWYDYGFPHVIQALQPEGRYFMSWAQLKSHIKPGSLFAQFVR
jgi:hypothetical protein